MPIEKSLIVIYKRVNCVEKNGHKMICISCRHIFDELYTEFDVIYNKNMSTGHQNDSNI